MVEFILITTFLIILALGVMIFKLIKHYLKLCRMIEKNSANSQKIINIYKNSLIFFILLSFIFLILFLIS